MGKTLNNIGNIYFLMGEYENSIANYSRSIEIKEELQDNKGLASSTHNIGETYFYQADYNNAIQSFRKSSGMIDDKDNEFENESLGMSHYYMANWDSCNIYMKRSDEYFFCLCTKRLAILPYRSSHIKEQETSNAPDETLKVFENLSQENECEGKDLIIGNWAAYEAYDYLGKNDEAQGFLEDAYFEMKSRSKDIKNKADRNKFLRYRSSQ